MKKKLTQKHPGGAPSLGLGPRFSIALFEDQYVALCQKSKRTKKERMEILREHLKRHPIQ